MVDSVIGMYHHTVQPTCAAKLIGIQIGNLDLIPKSSILRRQGSDAVRLAASEEAHAVIWRQLADDVSNDE